MVWATSVLSSSSMAGDAQGNKKTRKTYMQELVVDSIGSRLQIQDAMWIPPLVRDGSKNGDVC